jgi:hypothetical protein
MSSSSRCPRCCWRSGAFWLAAQFIKPAPPDSWSSAPVARAAPTRSSPPATRTCWRATASRWWKSPPPVRRKTWRACAIRTFEVDAAFIQGGTARPVEDDACFRWATSITSRCGFSTARRPGQGDNLLDLKGKRIAVGGAGSGTRHLAMELLAANGIDAKNTKLIEVGGLELMEKLQKNEIDAVFVVGPTQSSLVWSLLYTPGRAADEPGACRGLHAALSVPGAPGAAARGHRPDAGHSAAGCPTGVADGDPAGARGHASGPDRPADAGGGEVHGEPGVFQKPREFPRAGHGEFPLSKEAERYYKSGKPSCSAICRSGRQR